MGRKANKINIIKNTQESNRDSESYEHSRVEHVFLELEFVE
jgi:hypothetical protein